MRMTLGITVIVNVWSAYNPAPSIALIVIVYVPIAILYVVC